MLQYIVCALDHLESVLDVEYVRDRLSKYEVEQIKQAHEHLVVLERRIKQEMIAQAQLN